MQALASTRHTTRPFSVSVKAPRVTSHKVHKSAGRAHTVQAMASASFYDLVAKDIDGELADAAMPHRTWTCLQHQPAVQYPT